MSSDIVPTCEICKKTCKNWCGACKKVGYCSREHQKQDWKSHKALCRSIPKTEKNDDVVEKNRNNTDSSEDTSVLLIEDLVIDKCNNVEAETPASMPKWVDMNSVPLNILEDKDITNNDKKVANDIITNMKKFGLSVCDNFLPSDKANLVFMDIQKMYKTKGKFKDGQTILNKRIDSDTVKKIRGDLVTWFNGTEKDYPGIYHLCLKMDTIMNLCQIGLGNYRIVERTKAMIACYPGKGASYKCHIDNPKKDGRCVTCIFYVNPNWDSKEFGGKLRIYPTALKPRTADIDPKYNRMITFFSDKRNPHEVLPAYHERFAVTCWYFDQEERNNALKTWAKDLPRIM